MRVHGLAAILAGLVQCPQALAAGDLVIEPCIDPLANVHVRAPDGEALDEIPVCVESVETRLRLADGSNASGPQPSIGVRRSGAGVEIAMPAGAPDVPVLRLDVAVPERRVVGLVDDGELVLSLETRPLPDDPRLWPMRFRVEGRPVAEIAAAIADRLGQKLEGLERLCDTPVSLRFERASPPVRGVLLLLAEECGVGLAFPDGGTIRVVEAPPGG
jgi:hypothetical protein